MNLHSKIKKFTNEFENVISDDSIFAINRTNRYIGELSIAEAFLNLQENKQRLALQDYEFYSNIPGYIRLLNLDDSQILVENHSKETAHWAMNFSVALTLLNNQVIFKNHSDRIKLKPSSNLALDLYSKIATYDASKAGNEERTISILFVSSTDELQWNKILEECRRYSGIRYIFAKNFNDKNVLEEPTLIATARVDVIQSITGWAMLTLDSIANDEKEKTRSFI